MVNSFEKHAIQLYSNFMKYTIANLVYNILITFIENATLIYIIDLMFYGDKILSQTFSIFYFLSPHLYLDIINQQFPNECDIIFQSNTTDKDLYKEFTTNTETSDIIFFNYKLYSTNNAFCVYSSSLLTIIIFIVVLITLFFIGLFFIDSRVKKTKVNPMIKIVISILTNSISLFIRPFLIMIAIILVNRPLILLYKYSDIHPEHLTAEILLTVLSLMIFLYFIAFTYVNYKFINNTFYFETFPYDYFTLNETMFMLIIKIVIALKINFNKLLGENEMTPISLIIGVFVILKAANTFGNRGYYINQVYLRKFSVFLSLFDCFFIVIKLINQYVVHFQFYSTFSHCTELSLITIVLGLVVFFLFPTKTMFEFSNSKDFLIESIQFFYYIYTNLSLTANTAEKKQQRNQFIDNVIIDHKMKCKIESCTICSSVISNPNLRALCTMLYSHFIEHEKEYKEQNEGLALQIKLMFIRSIDANNIHRVSFIVLKNRKNKNISLSTFLKINYLYAKSIDELNRDLKGLLTMKYSQVYDDLLDCIKNFESILGFIKSHTEKVKLVINKMEHIGNYYTSILQDLFFLKKNKRIYYDPANLLQIICIIRLIFHKNVDQEISNNIDYNVYDFLDLVDHSFLDNISFLIKYDFNNKTWRIMKIPKKFIDNTQYKISELLDQSLERIFPKTLARSRMRKLEDEIMLSNRTDSKIQFETIICDAQANVKFVKFIIDIIPHLENSYLLYMQCHFHKRQLIIIDEYGNFINGSDALYSKVGINSEIVASSKGRINMYTLFNIEKKTNLEEIRTALLCTEGVNKEMKKIFLLENAEIKKDLKQTVTPGFLNNFLFDNMVNSQKKKIEKTTVIFKLYEKEVVNDLKYFIFNIKLNNVPKFKSMRSKKNKYSSKVPKFMDSINKLKKISNIRLSTKNVINHKTENPRIRKMKTSFAQELSSSSDENKEILKKNNSQTVASLLNDMENDINETSHESNIKPSQNRKSCNDVLNQKKTQTNNIKEGETEMLLIPNNNTNNGTVNKSLYNGNMLNMDSSSSVANSTNYDVFTFLHMKTLPPKVYSIKFKYYLSVLFVINFCLILYGLCSIIYINSLSGNILKLSEIIDIYHRLSIRIAKATFNFMTILKYTEKGGDSLFNDYLNHKDIPLNYDELLPKFIDFDSSLILNELTIFYAQTFEYFDIETFDKQINFNDTFVHLAPSGNYSLQTHSMKVISDIFVLTINQLANQNNIKLYLNISYLEYTYLSESIYDPNFMFLTTINPDLLTEQDKDYFINRINIYQHLFNYFNAYYLNGDQINSFLSNYLTLKIKSMHITTQVLIELIAILNFLFVLFLFTSIIMYKQLLQKEFADLYSLNEESINRLKEKYSYVKALIKWEQAPSKLYNNIRQMRIDIAQAELNEKLQKKNSKQRKDEEGDEVIASKYINFSGAISGQFRSNTIKTKEYLAKEGLKEKEEKVSLFLINRLNFDFEKISQLFKIIILMSIVFLIIGIFSLLFFAFSYKNILDAIEITTLLQYKFLYLYNYSNANKLIIMFNKESPFTLFEGQYSPNCVNCSYNLFSNHSAITDSMSSIEEENNQVSFFTQMGAIFTGAHICHQLFMEFKSNFLEFITNYDNTILTNFKELCLKIPLLQSNTDSIFSEAMISLRKKRFFYIYSDKNLEARIKLLTEQFIYCDIVLSLFGQFYLEYIYDNFMIGLIRKSALTYFTVLFYILAIVIVLDLVLIIVIWTKICKEILSSVNDVQLVTEAVSCI